MDNLGLFYRQSIDTRALYGGTVRAGGAGIAGAAVFDARHGARGGGAAYPAAYAAV